MFVKEPQSIHAAKTHLSRLVERACAGEEVIIACGKTPVAKLVSLEAIEPCRRFGAMRGRARVPVGAGGVLALPLGPMKPPPWPRQPLAMSCSA